ncbi:rab effector Noc2-like [Nomascus leucogenys]|uniref:rab effector Noc2-like n=1 Tax=Nomascus leucogenys TaxID=61853 RepID=UPI00122D75B8|nr:rab effector Noc2-like [Nomascus leucogenys]
MRTWKQSTEPGEQRYQERLLLPDAPATAMAAGQQEWGAWVSKLRVLEEQRDPSESKGLCVPDPEHLPPCEFRVWKRSGAWFYKGLPKYILPLKTLGRADDPHFRPLSTEPAEREPRSSETSRTYTWARGRVVSSDSDSDSDLSSSSLEDRLPPTGVRDWKGDKPWKESGKRVSKEFYIWKEKQA